MNPVCFIKIILVTIDIAKDCIRFSASGDTGKGTVTLRYYLAPKIGDEDEADDVQVKNE